MLTSVRNWEKLAKTNHPAINPDYLISTRRCKMFGKFVFNAVLIFNLVTQCWAAETVLKAAVMGYKDKVSIESYQAIADALIKEDKNFKYCRIEFTPLEYDRSNGSAVYKSLTKARETFENTSVAVAIGPQIDVFTSTDYVILHQVHFVTSADEALEPANRTMPLLPDPSSLSKAIVEIINYMEWQRVAFLSQEDFSPVIALGGAGVFVSPIRLPSRITSSDNPQLKQTLTTLRESQIDKFILHSMNKDVVELVIKAAKDLHLLHHSISWFITYLDFLDVVDDIKEMAKLYGLQLLKPEKLEPAVTNIFNNTVSRLQQGLMCDVVGILKYYLDVYASCDQEPLTDSYITAEELRVLLRNEQIKWTNDYHVFWNGTAMVVNTTRTGDVKGTNFYTGVLGWYYWPIIDGEQTSNARNDYNIPVWRYMSRQIKYAQVIFRKSGIETNGFVDKPPPIVTEPFKDKSFQVVAKQDEPFVMQREDGKYEGFCVDVLKELSKRLSNFNFTIFELDDDSVGKNGKGKEWDAIIEQLKIGNASLAIGAFAVNSDREEKISFSYTIMSSSVSLLLLRPENSVNFFQFLGPFSIELWIMILVFFLMVGLGLFVMSKFDSTQVNVEERFDLKESLWYSVTVLLQGSTEYSPQTTSMRTVVVFVWFCTLVINAAYTANLAAFLTLQQIDNRVKTVDALARQTKVKYGLLNNSDLMNFFAKNRDDPYERMWAFMKLNEGNSLLNSRAVGLSRVLADQDYAYLDDGVINNYLAQQNCEVESIEQNFGIKHFSIGFPKGAPYRGDINRKLLALKEDGTLDRLRNKWWDSRSNCTQQIERSSTKQNTASELDISNMFGVFIVLIVFTVLAILWEIGTVVLQAYREKQQKKLAKEEENPGQPTIANFQFGIPQPDIQDNENVD